MSGLNRKVKHTSRTVIVVVRRGIGEEDHLRGKCPLAHQSHAVGMNKQPRRAQFGVVVSKECESPLLLERALKGLSYGLSAVGGVGSEGGGDEHGGEMGVSSL